MCREVAAGCRMPRMDKTWNFAVVGTDAKGPRYLGFTETYEDAVKLQGNMATIGWQGVAIFNPSLAEVKEKPKG